MPLPCLKPRRSSKVCPAPNTSNDVDLVEVRKGRMLRIQHINPRLRNKQVPQSKHGKNQAPAAPLELHVPRVSFYGNKFVVKDTPTPNSNHVKNSGSGPSPNNNRASPHGSGQNNNGGRCVKSNSFPSNLSKEQKRMLFKMGVRSVSALKNIVLFFFHGVGGSSDIWQTQINYFSSLGFEIVAPDLIGHGMSEVPLKKRAYHFREILADVLAIFDRYCKKKNLVIGHSYGCAFTTVLARERARRVWRLIMISGGGPIPLAPEIGIFAFPLWFVSCIRPCLDQVFEKSAFKKKQKNEMLKRASFNIPSFVLHYVINGQDWPEGDETYHSWISVPTLLINGREDTFATLDDAKLMKTTIHGSKLEIVDEASHMVMLEAPDKVNKLILDFICSRGSHKLPDVKEAAEEGQESPRKVTPTCCYSTGVNNMNIHPFHLHHHQHHLHQHAHQSRAQTPPAQSLRSNVTVPPRPGSAPPSTKSPVTILVDSLECSSEDEVDPYTPPEHYAEETLAVHQQGYSVTPVLKLAKRQLGSSYDNASYESDESGEEYYYYKDMYGNHHYISSKEYTRQFPRSELPPASYQSNETEMETVDIPAFEDISVEHSLTDGNVTEGEITPDYSSPRSYPVEINAQHPNHMDTEGDPDYMTHHNDHEYESYEMSDVSESPSLSQSYAREMDTNRAPRFSVPELQFCEECIRKKDNAQRTTDCERCININIAAVGYRERQNSFTRRQSVTLALGRQRSDSLDYLGEEQLIIITCYDKTEKEEISTSSSTTDQQGNQRATRHGQRTAGQEQEEAVRHRPSLTTLNEQEEEYSPGVKMRSSRWEIGPAKKQNAPNEDLVSSLHKELLAKVNKRNIANGTEERKIPKEGRIKMNVKPPIASELDEGVVSRSPSFLASKQLMEAHFSKSAFKMQPRCPLPGLTSSGRSSVPPKVPPKVLGPKPERPYHLPAAQLTSKHSERGVERTSPSFLQSKRVIHEHFSKIGHNSPMCRPFSSPNLGGYGGGSDIRAISPQGGRNLSNSSPATLAKPQAGSEESLASDPDEESSISRRLSIGDWADKHVKRVRELSSPENPRISVETSESASSASRSGSSGSGSLVSISEWAERHVKRIAVANTPPTSLPYNATSKENDSPRCSPGKQEIADEEKRPGSSLSLNDWADKHLKLVASRMAPTHPVSASKDEGRTSSEKEASSPKGANSLTLSGWSQRHLQKVAELQKASQKGSGIVRPKSPTPSEEGVVSSRCSPGKREIADEEAETGSSLNLKAWADRHLKLVASKMTSPVSMQKAETRTSPVSMQKAETRTSPVSMQKAETRTSPVSMQKAETRTSPYKEASIPKAIETAQNESEIVDPKSSTTPSKDGAVETKVGSSRETDTNTLSINEWAESHVRKIEDLNSRSPKGLQLKHSAAQSSPVYEYTLVRTPVKSAKLSGNISTNALNEWAEKHVRKLSEEKLVSRPNKVEKVVEKDTNNKIEGKATANVSAIGQELGTSTSQSDRSSPLKGPHQRDDQSLDQEEKAPQEKTINTSAITKDTSERDPTECNRGTDACTSDNPQQTQEVKSSGQTSLSNKPSFSRIPEIRVEVSDIDSDLQVEPSLMKLIDTPTSEEPLGSVCQRPAESRAPVPDIDPDSQLASSHENLTDLQTSEDQLRSVRQQRRSSLSQSPTKVPEIRLPDGTDTEFLTNRVTNNNNNNNDNDNSDPRERFTAIPATTQTFDSNSNVVASTSVSSREDNKDSGDIERAPCEEQQSLTLTLNPNQSAEKAEGPTDNDNNRIESVTTTDTDPPTNVSNVIAHTIV